MKFHLVEYSIFLLNTIMIQNINNNDNNRPIYWSTTVGYKMVTYIVIWFQMFVTQKKQHKND